MAMSRIRPGVFLIRSRKYCQFASAGRNARRTSLREMEKKLTVRGYGSTSLQLTDDKIIKISVPEDEGLFRGNRA